MVKMEYKSLENTSIIVIILYFVYYYFQTVILVACTRNLLSRLLFGNSDMQKNNNKIDILFTELSCYMMYIYACLIVF